MYDYKALQELGWFVVVAATTEIMQILVHFEPEKVHDWRSWLITLVAAAVRSMAGAVLSWLTKRAVSHD